MSFRGSIKPVYRCYYFNMSDSKRILTESICNRKLDWNFDLENEDANFWLIPFEEQNNGVRILQYVFSFTVNGLRGTLDFYSFIAGQANAF